MTNLIWKLRDTALFDAAYRRTRDMIWGPGWGGFHRDRIYRAMMLDLLDAIPFSSFVETGTYRGYSAELVARHWPQLPVFTVEVAEATYRRAKPTLDRYPNVTALLGSSDTVLRQL